MKQKRSIRISAVTTRGFTLIETMVIVAIIGLLAGLTIPAFARYVQGQKVQGARNELMADLQYARSLAIARRATFRVDFTDAVTYQIIQTGPETVMQTNTAPDGVTFNADVNPSFFAWGLSDAANIVVAYGAKTSNVQLLPNGTVTHD